MHDTHIHVLSSRYLPVFVQDELVTMIALPDACIASIRTVFIYAMFVWVVVFVTVFTFHKS